MTQAGMILGTAAYMSPEQAGGKPVDKRSDIWAFGVVVLEMLTGRPVFTGETVSHVIASVLKSEPDWTALPRDTPAPIRKLLRRCLEKDRKRRLDSAAAARLEIEDTGSGTQLVGADAGSSRVAMDKRRAMAALVAAGLGALLAGGVAFWTWPRPDVSSLARFTETPRGNVPLTATLSLNNGSARGDFARRTGASFTWLAGQLSTEQVYLRALDQLEAVPIGGVGRRRGVFFSPDGQWVGYSDGALLLKAPVTGGPPATVCKLDGLPRGASWGEDDTIVFATNTDGKGLFRVAAGGGTPEVLTTPDAAKGERLHELPEILPGGRGVLFTILRAAGSTGTGLRPRGPKWLFLISRRASGKS